MAQYEENYNTLKEALNGVYKVYDLKSLAQQISTKYPQRKAELVDHITSIMLNKPGSVMAKLGPMAKNALAEAVYNWDGIFKNEQFNAKYGVSPLNESTKTRGERHLLFLFFINGKIPDDLMRVLQKQIKKPESEKIHYSDLCDMPDFTVRETAHAACMNLNILLTMVSEKKIRVSEKTGRAPAATIKKISAALCDGDFYDADIGPMQAFAWPLLLQGGGLATIDGKFLKLTKAGSKALKNDLAQGIKMIWKKWEKTKIIDEYSRVKAVKGQKSAKGRTMTSPARRRPVINNALACLEPGKWVTVDEMARFMVSEDYTFEMTNYDWKLYFSDPNYGLLDYFDTWSLLQFRYLLIYFFEYCATLGLLDVSYKDPNDARTDFRSCWGTDDEPFLSMCDGLTQIRLNDLGAYVLGLSTEYGTLDPHAFEIHDTDIIYKGKGSPSPDQSLFLDKIADQKEVGKWHVSLISLLSAVKTGETLKEIKDFINQIASGKPGDSLGNLFKKVEERSTIVVKKGTVTLLQCHLEIRKQILSDKKLSHLCMPAGERHIVILPDKDELFARSLETLGVIIGN